MSSITSKRKASDMLDGVLLSSFTEMPVKASPSSQQLTILLVGTRGSGKQTLAEDIVNLDPPAAFSSLQIQIRTSSVLPLPVETEADDDAAPRPRIDFVAVVIDSTSHHSLLAGQDFLNKIGSDYTAGGRCILLTKCDRPSKMAFDMAEVEGLADSYACPLLRSTPEKRISVSRAIRYLAMTFTGRVSGNGQSVGGALLTCGTLAGYEPRNTSIVGVEMDAEPATASD